MQNRSGISREDAEEFSESLGQILGGGWRQILLAQRMGVPNALGMSTEQWVREWIGGYIRLSIDERREAVRELAEEGLSQREIADVVGVSHVTVGNDLRGKDLPDNSDDSACDVEPYGQKLTELVIREFVDRETGEVLTAEAIAEQESQEEAESLIAALPDPDGKADIWRLRQMVARGLSQFSSNVLVLDPVAASEACDEGQRRDMRHFRKQVDEWIAAFERAESRGLRAVR